MKPPKFMAVAGGSFIVGSVHEYAGRGPNDLLGPTAMFLIGVALWVPLLWGVIRRRREAGRVRGASPLAQQNNPLHNGNG